MAERTAERTAERMGGGRADRGGIAPRARVRRAPRLAALWLMAQCVAMGVLLAPGVGAEQPAKEDVSPEQLAAEAKALAREKRWEEALPKFRAAYDKRRSYDVVGNLGITEHELGLWVPAAEHLSEALRGFPVGGPEVQRAALEQRLADAEKRIVKLTVKVDPPSACLQLGERQVGCGPFTYPLYHEAGEVTLRATAPGHRAAKHHRTAAPGEALALALTLAPFGPDTSSEDKQALLPAWPSYVVSGVGLAAIVTGAGLRVASDGADRSATEQLDALKASSGRATPCDGPAPSDAGACDAIASDLRRHDTLQNASTGLVFTGVGLLAASGVLFGLSFVEAAPEPASSQARLMLVPQIGPGGVALMAAGSW